MGCRGFIYWGCGPPTLPYTYRSPFTLHYTIPMALTLHYATLYLSTIHRFTPLYIKTPYNTSPYLTLHFGALQYLRLLADRLHYFTLLYTTLPYPISNLIFTTQPTLRNLYIGVENSCNITTPTSQRVACKLTAQKGYSENPMITTLSTMHFLPMTLMPWFLNVVKSLHLDFIRFFTWHAFGYTY